jgi:ABC-type transport system involved in cytochrome bd biosynthesis fused ATPase/permease subunit
VIEHGRVVEQGFHQSLMQADGPYASLFQEQFNTQLKRNDTEAPTVEVA